MYGTELHLPLPLAGCRRQPTTSNKHYRASHRAVPFYFAHLPALSSPQVWTPKNVNYSLRFTEACPRGLPFVGTTWLRLNAAAAARATSVASLITSSSCARCVAPSWDASAPRFGLKLLNCSSNCSRRSAHLAAIESRIEPRSTFPHLPSAEPRQRRVSSSTSRATPFALCRRHSIGRSHPRYRPSRPRARPPSRQSRSQARPYAIRLRLAKRRLPP